MDKNINKLIKRYIEKNYGIWGTKIETELPPEFIITDHALESLEKRFNCCPNKYHKIMVKAWNSPLSPNKSYIKKANKKHPSRTYKIFNGFIFVFHTEYNKKAGFTQKFLITVYKKKGYQVEN